MAGQNTFQSLLLNDAKMIGERKKTRMKMLYGCPFEKTATLEITNLALLIPCMEFEFFCGQIPLFEVL